eukprot:NODE_3435_length_1353_cov_26.224390_g2997_i0.p1 GENE.NODE_3435_length_1353_cov_26.224390_g2997_i0~~NODE_3435_length_1353_cov_26.224390_g2997_i0.p1  ORF type:complete len:287 (-),score=70.28 NODE_3435_length_1353_cov_26.224390_g2997_i0:261-1121(-)
MNSLEKIVPQILCGGSLDQQFLDLKSQFLEVRQKQDTCNRQMKDLEKQLEPRFVDIRELQIELNLIKRRVEAMVLPPVPDYQHSTTYSHPNRGPYVGNSHYPRHPSPEIQSNLSNTPTVTLQRPQLKLSKSSSLGGLQNTLPPNISGFMITPSAPNMHPTQPIPSNNTQNNPFPFPSSSSSQNQDQPNNINITNSISTVVPTPHQPTTSSIRLVRPPTPPPIIANPIQDYLLKNPPLPTSSDKLLRNSDTTQHTSQYTPQVASTDLPQSMVESDLLELQRRLASLK